MSWRKMVEALLSLVLWLKRGSIGKASRLTSLGWQSSPHHMLSHPFTNFFNLQWWYDRNSQSFFISNPFPLGYASLPALDSSDDAYSGLGNEYTRTTVTILLAEIPVVRARMVISIGQKYSACASILPKEHFLSMPLMMGHSTVQYSTCIHAPLQCNTHSTKMFLLSNGV